MADYRSSTIGFDTRYGLYGDIHRTRHSREDRRVARDDQCSSTQQAIACIAVSVALAALAAVAAYFLFSTGFHYVDFGFTAAHRFAAGFTLYMGGAFAIAAIINILAPFYFACIGEYKREHAAMQSAITFVAPLTIIPAAIRLGVLNAICGN